MGVKALKAQVYAELGVSEKVLELLNGHDEKLWADLEKYLVDDRIDEDIQDDHIDEDIQAADMAAEDMEDNTEEEWQ